MNTTTPNPTAAPTTCKCGVGETSKAAHHPDCPRRTRRTRRQRGTLVWTGENYSARFSGGPLIPLHTDDKRVAKAHLARLAAGGEHASAPDASGVETFRQAAERVVKVQIDKDVPSAPARISRLRRWAFPELGDMLVTGVRPGHITTVLEHVAALGRSSTTLAHMRGDMIYVFGRLLKEEVVTRNPARGELVDTPSGTDDPRPRVILRDEEFVRFVNAPTTPPALRMMAIVSRACGGMRTSDLRAWMWGHVDTQTWLWADIPRPKTTTKKKKKSPGEPAYVLERLELLPEVAGALREWWTAAGRPNGGVVFPMPAARVSFAAVLRATLLTAGVDRHELHHNTDRSKRVDFHSFRRAWATAIGKAGLNAQTAMAATGHRQMSTHMRYQVHEVIAIPTSAVPTWGTSAGTAEDGVE
jgi:integrase